MTHEHDEIASAHADGVATPEEQAALDADPTLRAAAERVGRLRAELADVEPPSSTARESAIAAALAEFDAIARPDRPADRPAELGAPDTVAPPIGAPLVESLDERRARRFHWSHGLGIAAAALAVVGVGVVVSQRDALAPTADQAQIIVEGSVNQSPATAGADTLLRATVAAPASTVELNAAAEAPTQAEVTPTLGAAPPTSAAPLTPATSTARATTTDAPAGDAAPTADEPGAVDPGWPPASDVAVAREDAAAALPAATPDEVEVDDRNADGDTGTADETSATGGGIEPPLGALPPPTNTTPAIPQLDEPADLVQLLADPVAWPSPPPAVSAVVAACREAQDSPPIATSVGDTTTSTTTSTSTTTTFTTTAASTITIDPATPSATVAPYGDAQIVGADGTRTVVLIALDGDTPVLVDAVMCQVDDDLLAGDAEQV